MYRTRIAAKEFSFPVYSAVTYSLVAQKVLLGAKESALEDADQLIRQAVLRHSRIVKDQTTLNSRMREKNLSQSMRCANRAEPSNIPVIIIDDLVTSGATLREAGRALHEGGFTVLGAVTACVAKPLRYTQ